MFERARSQVRAKGAHVRQRTCTDTHTHTHAGREGDLRALVLFVHLTEEGEFHAKRRRQKRAGASSGGCAGPPGRPPLPSPRSKRPLLWSARAPGPARGRPWSGRAVRASLACGRLASLALGCLLLAGSCGRGEEGAASQTQRPAGSNLCSCPRLAGKRAAPWRSARLLRSPVPSAPSFPWRRAPKRAADGARVEDHPSREPRCLAYPPTGGRLGPA